MSYATVTSDLWFLRLRKTPTILSTNVIGALRNGARLEVLGTSGNWTNVRASSADFFDPNTVSATVEGWVVSSLIRQDTVSPPTPTARYLTGVNCNMNAHMTDKVFGEGCRFALVMDNFQFASQLKDKYPDSIVMVRRYLAEPQNVLTVEQGINALEGASDPDLIYTLFCEGSGRPLEAQVKFDLDMAAALNAKFNDGKIHYAAGTFAMGTPEFNDPNVCKILSGYASAYNAGKIGIDMHLYSPILDHIFKDDDLIWYERRWEFLFTKCGFDPRVRAVYCSETGEDEGGVGGFPAHNRNAEDVVRWVKQNRIVQTRPIVVDGVSYPSPAVGCAIFQLGNENSGPGGWAGYHIAGYTDALKPYWTV